MPDAQDPGASQPSKLGRYPVLGSIGRGGMGEVFEVLDHTFERKLAAKRAADDDPVLRERFVQEAQICGRLEHPGIAPIHDLGFDKQGRPFFTMKRISGRTLSELIEDEAPLSQLLRIFLAVCDTIAFAHSEGILHRDLKPSNLMVGAFGETYVVDWGLAREAPLGQAPDSSATPRMTLAGQMLGTPGYIAPEVILGAGDRIDARADVYALGAILYQLAVGERAFSGDKESVVQQQLAGLVESHQARLAELPFALAAIVRKAMAKSRRERYASAVELRDEVSRYLDDQLVQAARYGLGRRVWRMLRRHRARALLVVVGLVCLGLLAADRRQRFLRERERAERARQRATARQAAGDAHAAGRWADALAAAERAGALGAGDPQLGELVSDARARIAHAAAAAELARRLDPLQRAIEHARLLRYVPRFDMGSTFRGLREQLAEVEPLTGVSRFASFAELWFTAGDARLMLGEHQQAAAALRRAHELAPTRRSIRLALARAMLMEDLQPRRVFVEARDPERTAFLVELLRDGGEQGDLASEVMALRRLNASAADEKQIVERADRALARHAGKLGSEELYLLRSLRRPSRQQLADLALALERRPHYPEAHLLRAYCYRHHQLWPQALAEHEAALRLVPGWLPARRGRARALIQTGDRAAGMRELEAIHKLTRRPTDLVALASARVLTGELERGLAEIAQAVAAEPKVTEHHINRARLLIAARRYEEAAESCAAAIACSWHVTLAALARGTRGEVRFLQGRYPEAERDLTRAIEEVPHPDFRRWRARTRNQLGDAPGVIEDIAAISVRLRVWDDWMIYASALTKLERYREAVDAMGRALPLAPPNQRPMIQRAIEHTRRFVR